MLRVLLIGTGGFIGSVLRYMVSGYFQSLMKSFELPYGTLAVNISGCLVIGFLAQLADAHGMFSPETRAFLFIGILGGFTTFSTFGNETLHLMRDREHLFAVLNITAHIIFGLGAVWAGRTLVQILWR